MWPRKPSKYHLAGVDDPHHLTGRVDPCICYLGYCCILNRTEGYKSLDWSGDSQVDGYASDTVTAILAIQQGYVSRHDCEPVLVCFRFMVTRVKQRQRFRSGACGMTEIGFRQSAHGHCRA